MNDNKLYFVNKSEYPEDWVLVYTNTLAKLIEQYCKETDKELLSVDEFYEEYEYCEI